MSDLFFRPLRAGEFGLFSRFAAAAAGVGARSRTLEEYFAAGDFRPEWTWVAVREGAVVARAAFWAPAGYRHPFSLEWFDLGGGSDRVEVGAALLRAAYAAVVTPDYFAPSHPDGDRPDYHLFLPADWRERPDAHAEATDRIAAAEQAGLRFSVERLNLRWTPAQGLPARSTRLRFTAATDNRLILDALAGISTDTLDIGTQHDIQQLGLRPAAQARLDKLAGMPGGRDWWRLAVHPRGDLVGILMPTHNGTTATIGYLGVLPEHRGQHYSDDLVTEALHLFTAAGETEATDNTDVGNTPMAASFARVGYRVTGRRMIFT
jgi:ribosomal protein S18 acetylase RimI-like enzyme